MNIRNIKKIELHCHVDGLLNPRILRGLQPREEIRALIEKMEQMDPKQLEEDVFKEFDFDLCRKCQQGFVKDPLGNRSSEGEPSSDFPPFDVDDFLRRLDNG